ncbi:hypothetical protein [Pueribacillus sp. YX66]|uniref:hypothetical protein n=1 Tax=Pueribacillus sp. YX66 TaxID=3229242 RepID=UPI00358D84E7
MKYAEYLRSVEGLSEEQINNRMRGADFESYSAYLRYCRENGIEREPYEDVFWADRW